MKAKAPKSKHSAFKSYEPGYLHIDVKYLPQMQNETKRRYLFVAIDRATLWVFIRIYNNKTTAKSSNSSRVFVIISLRRRLLPGTQIRTS
jgi:hypothetical protein